MEEVYADIWMETSAAYTETDQYYAELMSAMTFTTKIFIVEKNFTG